MSSAVVNRPCPNGQCAMWGKVGTEVRTPAMQAGLVAKRLTFRDVFTAVAGFFLFAALLIGVRWWRQELSQRFVAA